MHHASAEFNPSLLTGLRVYKTNTNKLTEINLNSDEWNNGFYWFCK